MKRKYIKAIGLFGLVTAISLSSCSDNFLEEKKDYGGINEQVFQSPALASGYVDYVYNMFLPANNAVVYTWDIAVAGGSDFTQSTEELGGEVNWNKLWTDVSPRNANCLPYIGGRITSSVTNNTWTRIREINKFLDEIDNHGMADADKNPLKGQMYFWRAWQYFDMVKLYGGVPIVLTAQDPIVSDSGLTQVPRSSTSACIEQIVSDLDKAQTLLKDVKWGDADWGRITAGAAAAFKGRVLLTWASPLFNPSDDATRWQRAYDANLAAKTLLETVEGKKLFVTGGTAGGTAWGNMWFPKLNANNSEAVIVFGFNNLNTTAQKNNGWEKACRSKTAGGSGSVSPTAQMVDAFPMLDGKDISSSSTTYPYNPQRFYKNRDPRFNKTFVYNGAAWPYAANTSFKQWTYSWYTAAATTTQPNPQRFTETLGANSTGIYLCKATSPTADNTSQFIYSNTNYMEMRFAEVVLNLAESAIGINSLAEGKTLIESIRIRAGITNGDGHYGLANVSSRDQHFAAVLKERRIEFAYENKRFYDLRRWMLFDDAHGTITRLGGAANGFVPLAGSRRTGYFIVAKNTDGSEYIDTKSTPVDPYLPNATTGIAPIVNRDPTFPYTIPATGVNPGTVINNSAAYMDYLYDNYFEIKVKDNVDPTTNNWKYNFYDQYYYFGIYQSLLDSAPYLKQTKGWGGDFDPLQ